MIQQSSPSPDKSPATVREMFARIAHAYDLNNHLHSLWQDQCWRRAAVRLANPKPTDCVLDLACGTGDVTAMLARTGARRVVGADYCQEMLDLAQRKCGLKLPITWRQADAMALPFDDGEFDIATIAFGIRNVADPRKALTELLRVLKPGGRLVVLEFNGGGADGLLGPFVRFYTDRIMPISAGWIAGDKDGAYRYLCQSVRSFLTAGQLAQLIGQCGFGDVQTQRLSFGIASLHGARRQ